MRLSIQLNLRQFYPAVHELSVTNMSLGESDVTGFSRRPGAGEAMGMGGYPGS